MTAQVQSRETMEELERFAPLWVPPEYSEEERWALTPFVTSLDEPIYSFRTGLVPSQLLGAIFSRASRTTGDIREVFWREYLRPVLHPEEEAQKQEKPGTEEEWQRKLDAARELREIIQFHHDHPNPPYNAKRAYQFFAKVFSDYGDESVAQMVNANVVMAAVSQPAIKWVED